ncbi:MAG: 30S ribosomal protein S16 [Candidatus Daviesbacteria bacterium]|nr:30S ribosomal protein S16 [Candidatus Daviesbacteria bacterium]
MLKIRLMRIGARKKPFYRVVVVDERAKRTGACIELLGTYNPLTEPKDIKLKQDRIDHWVKQGAQMSTGFLRITGKAPQRPPRKPKKESKQATGDSEQVKTEKQVEETPKEEVTKETTKPEPEVGEKSEDVKASADQSLSEPGEDGQKAQAMTSVTPSEPVTSGASEASLTGEQANIEPVPESEKNERSA